MGHSHSKATVDRQDCQDYQVRRLKTAGISPSLLHALNREPASLSPLLALQEKISTVFLHGGEQASRVARRLDLYRRHWQFAREHPILAPANHPAVPLHPHGCVVVGPPRVERLANSDLDPYEWHVPMAMVDLFWHFSLDPVEWESWRFRGRGNFDIEDWPFPPSPPPPSDKRQEQRQQQQQIEDLLPTFDGHVAAARQRGETAVMLVAFDKRIADAATRCIQPDGARLRPDWGYGFALAVGPEGVVVWMARPLANRGGLNHYVADGHARLLSFADGRRTVELMRWFAACRGEWDEEKIDMYVELMRGDEAMFQHHRRFAGECVVDASCANLFVRSISGVTREGVSKFVWLAAEEGDQRYG